jgi:hypothetical protein
METKKTSPLQKRKFVRKQNDIVIIDIVAALAPNMAKENR